MLLQYYSCKESQRVALKKNPNLPSKDLNHPQNPPPHAPLYGYLGLTLSLTLSVYGCSVGFSLLSPSLLTPGSKGGMREFVGIVMISAISVYGLITSLLITSSVIPPISSESGNVTQYGLIDGFRHLCAGLCCGMSCMVAAVSVGVGCRGFLAALRYHEGEEVVLEGREDGGKEEETSPLLGGDGGDGRGEGTDYDSTVANGDDGGVGGRVVVKGAYNMVFTGMVIVCIFGEAIAIYGMIVAVVLV